MGVVSQDAFYMNPARHAERADNPGAAPQVEHSLIPDG